MFFQKFNFTFSYPLFILLHLTVGQNMLYNNAFKKETASLIDPPQTSMASFTTSIFRFGFVYSFKGPQIVHKSDKPFYTSSLATEKSINTSELKSSENDSPLNPMKSSIETEKNEPDISVSKDSSETSRSQNNSSSLADNYSDSVAKILINISDLNLVYVDSSFNDTIESYSICYNEPVNQNSHSGTYSQSVSNLKDY